MKRRPVVLLDVDGVLVDFATSLIRTVEQVTGRPRTVSDLTGWNWQSALQLPADETLAIERRVADKGFCAGLAAYDGAKQFVADLQTLADVVAVTAPLPGGVYWADERQECLISDFGIDRRHTIHTSGKKWVAGDLFLDDHPANLAEWEHGQRLLMDRPWNQGVTWCTRVHTYQQVTKYFEKEILKWEKVQ